MRLEQNRKVTARPKFSKPSALCNLFKLLQLPQLGLATILLFMSGVPSTSQALPLGFDTDVMLLLAGPVSEAVQETILLVRRGDNFVSKDSIGIGCIAGATAGLLVGVAPYLGFIEASAAAATAPITGTYIVGTMLLSCTMTMASSAAGMGTVWALRQWRKWRHVTVGELFTSSNKKVKPPKATTLPLPMRKIP